MANLLLQHMCDPLAFVKLSKQRRTQVVKAPKGEVIRDKDETNKQQDKKAENILLGSPLRTDGSLPPRMSPSKRSTLEIYE